MITNTKTRQNDKKGYNSHKIARNYISMKIKILTEWITAADPFQDLEEISEDKKKTLLKTKEDRDSSRDKQIFMYSETMIQKLPLHKIQISLDLITMAGPFQDLEEMKKDPKKKKLKVCSFFLSWWTSKSTL